MDKKSFNSMGIDNQVIRFNSMLKDSSIRQVCKAIGIPKTTIRDRFTKKGYLYDPEQNQYIKSNVTDSNKKLTNSIKEETQSNKNITSSNIDKNQLSIGANNTDEGNKCPGNTESNIKLTGSNTEAEVNSNQNITSGNIVKENVVIIEAAIDKVEDNFDNTESKKNLTEGKMDEDIGSNKNITHIEVVEYKNIESEKEVASTTPAILEDEKYLYFKNNIEKIYAEIVELVDLKDDIKDIIKKKKIEEHVIELKDVKINNFNGELKVKTIKMYEEVIDEFNNFMDGHKELKQQDVISQAVWEFIRKYK